MTVGLFLTNPATTFTAPDPFGVRVRFKSLWVNRTLGTDDLVVASITAKGGDWHDDEARRCSVTCQLTAQGVRMNNRGFATAAPKDGFSTGLPFQAIANRGEFILELAVNQATSTARGRLLRFSSATQSVTMLSCREGPLSASVPKYITSIGAVLAIDHGLVSATVDVRDFRLYV